MKKNHCRIAIRNDAGRALRAGLWAALCMLLPMSPAAQAQAQAQTQAQNPTVANSEVGHSTRAWLALQRSNAQAAPAQPMLGAEAGRAYQRYLKSFDTPIPATFGSSVNSNGASGLGSASSGSGAAL